MWGNVRREMEKHGFFNPNLPAVDPSVSSSRPQPEWNRRAPVRSTLARAAWRGRTASGVFRRGRDGAPRSTHMGGGGAAAMARAVGRRFSGPGSSLPEDSPLRDVLPQNEVDQIIMRQEGTAREAQRRWRAESAALLLQRAHRKSRRNVKRKAADEDTLSEQSATRIQAPAHTRARPFASPPAGSVRASEPPPTHSSARRTPPPAPPLRPTHPSAAPRRRASAARTHAA